MGVLGGALIAFTSLGITPEKYFENIVQYVEITSFVSGIVKSVFFGVIIAVISCCRGFKTSGGAEGVGKSTIAAVVLSSMTILVSDYFLTYLLTFLGL